MKEKEEGKVQENIDGQKIMDLIRIADEDYTLINELNKLVIFYEILEDSEM